MPNHIQGSNCPLDSLTWEGMQPTSKVTRHRSEVKFSRRIRRVHEDLRAHQSIQTTSRQAMTHIHNMRAHLVVSRPRFGPNGHLVWPADHDGRLTVGWARSAWFLVWRLLGGPSCYVCGSWLVLSRFGSSGGPVDPRECVWFIKKVSPRIDDVSFSWAVSPSLVWLPSGPFWPLGLLVLD